MSFISSANRDPTVFELSDNIMSRNRELKHLSFGTGKHLCLGANLSKKVATKFFLNMNKINGTISLHHIDEKWISTIGYKILEKLAVNIEKRKV